MGVVDPRGRRSTIKQNLGDEEMRRMNLWMRAGWCGALTLLFAMGAGNSALAQQAGGGRWADKDDPVAKQLIEGERKWTVLGCTANLVVDDLIADDFVGTSPDGPLYTKEHILDEEKAGATEHDCKLLSARVRFFGSNVAIIYGKESAVLTGADGKEWKRTLIWTDTAMKRNGKWQLIAVQDMVDPKK